MSGFAGAGNLCSTAWFNGCRIESTAAANPGSGFASTVTANVCVASLSFTSFAVSVYVAATPTLSGLPRSRRVAASNDSPGGKLRSSVAGNGPVNAYATGQLPPVAAGNRTFTACPARYVCAATLPSVGVSSSSSVAVTVGPLATLP